MVLLFVNLLLCGVVAWLAHGRALKVGLQPMPYAIFALLLYIAVGYFTVRTIEGAFFMRQIGGGRSLSTMGLPIRMAICVGAGLLASGLMILLISARRKPQPPAAEPSEPQIAGMPCAQCGRGITSKLDGAACASCGALLHNRCLADHSCAAAASD
ncbi:MAG: hypothetical protein KC609_21035 [Myxococcales bacterium]|nr:hypothetical protein [Myxococcales bacterium]